MRYLVTARVKPGREAALLRAIERGTLGTGSVAGGEYLRNMTDARLKSDGTIRWVEVCFCAEPLAEERPYWEEYFELIRVQDAHPRDRCRDLTGAEPWACTDCDCTARLEQHLCTRGRPFLNLLHELAAATENREPATPPVQFEVARASSSPRRICRRHDPCRALSTGKMPVPRMKLHRHTHQMPINCKAL